MGLLWLIAASFVLVWIAEANGVANWYPVYGATGLLVTLIILAIIGASRSLTKGEVKQAIREEIGVWRR